LVPFSGTQIEFSYSLFVKAREISVPKNDYRDYAEECLDWAKTAKSDESTSSSTTWQSRGSTLPKDGKFANAAQPRAALGRWFEMSGLFVPLIEKGPAELGDSRGRIRHKLQGESDKCRARADECERKAKTAMTDEQREAYLWVAQDWLTLARGYEFADRLLGLSRPKTLH
jgi:hypothetical protein